MSLPNAGGFMPTPEILAQIDWNDKSSYSSAVYSVTIPFTAIVVIVVALRMATRVFFKERLFVDDYLILVATLCFIGCTITYFLAVNSGLGQHVWNLPLPMTVMFETVKRCIHIIYYGNILYATALFFTKASIISTFLRIFHHERPLILLLYGTSLVVTSMWLSSVLITIFQCTPIRAAWEFDIPGGGKCVDIMAFLHATTVINFIADLFVCLAPIPYCWRLNIPLRQRVIICFLFLVGLVAAACSVVRLAYLHTLTRIDVTYNLVPILNWSYVECALGIMCSSVPPLRPLFSKIAPQFLKGATSAARSKETGGAGGGAGSAKPSQQMLSAMSASARSARGGGGASGRRGPFSDEEEEEEEEDYHHYHRHHANTTTTSTASPGGDGDGYSNFSGPGGGEGRRGGVQLEEDDVDGIGRSKHDDEEAEIGLAVSTERSLSYGSGRPLSTCTERTEEEDDDEGEETKGAAYTQVVTTITPSSSGASSSSWLAGEEKEGPPVVRITDDGRPPPTMETEEETADDRASSGGRPHRSKSDPLRL